MSNGSGTSQDVISLPQGGGAQRGIGETFAPDLQTGTGNFSVPIALPSGRNGFQPQLNLGYSTGNGNGPSGLGWALSVPGISRKTSRGVPRYRDNSSETTAWDTFILSGAEDLVPVLESGHTRFRPRTEGLFAHIVRHRELGGDWWEVRSKDGLISRYGTRLQTDPADDWHDPAVLVDPADPSRIFAWKLAATEDPFGNAIRYDYRNDVDTGPQPRWAQSYLQRVRYIEYDTAGGSEYLVSVSFDYEPRPDVFTDHRAGFAIRTGLRCTSITVRTHTDQARTVRTYRLSYEQAPLNGVSLLRQVQLVGSDDLDTLPPLEFVYTQFEPERRHTLFPVTGPDAPPASLASLDYDLVDFSGDGLPDVVQLNGTARVWRNLGGGRFDRPTTMRDAPAGVALADPGVQIMDADGDGRADLVVTRDGVAGAWPLRFDGPWDRRGFRKYRRAPSFSLEDPEVRLVDLDGDGVADLIRAGDRLSCIFHDPQTATWHDPIWLRRGALEDLSTVSFADSRVKWADLSGDGLQDLAIVHQGSVRYWPNQGHGAWGAPVMMAIPDRLPWGYNPARLLFGDVDGDGLADMVYVDHTRVTLWVNRGGSAWSEPLTIEGTPAVSDADAVRIVDLLGSGIGGVLWTANAAIGLPRANYHFLDLTGAAKPYLLHRMDNHLGAVTAVSYRPSTIDYLRDAATPNTRWRTPLPFPVQVVAKVEVIDAISKGKLTTEYRYHHGYWDGAEREFRGFGMVEQQDTETFAIYHEPGLHGHTRFTLVPEQRFSPPTLTKTWFHLGPVGDAFGDWHELDYGGEYWPDDPPAFGRHETVSVLLTTYAKRRARRDALRTLRGRILRTELYALDGSRWQDRPYTVSEWQYGLREEAPPAGASGTRHHIFLPYLVAERTTQWERGYDPQIRITYTGAYDAWGQPTEQTSVALPRRKACRRPVTGAVVGELSGDEVNETRILATHTRTAYATAPAASDRLMADRVAHTRTVELRQPPTVTEQDPDDLSQVLRDGLDAALSMHETFVQAFKSWKPGDPLSDVIRLTSHTVHHYDGPAFTGLGPGELGDFGALTRTEILTFVVDEEDDTEDHLEHAYGARRPAYLGGAAALPNGAPAGFGTGLGYRRESRSAAGYHDGYYADTVRRMLDVQSPSSPQQWGVVTGTRDPLGNEARIGPDPFWLLPASVTDPAGLTTSATYDRRLLLPTTVTDLNGHVTTYDYTPLGLLKSVVLEGGTAAKPELAYDYDFHAYDATRNLDKPQPIWVHTKQRVWHARDGVPSGVQGGPDDLIESREYSDGFGRLIQKRAQADDLLFGGDGGDVGLLVNGKPVAGQVGGQAIGKRVTDRVVVSGWQVQDNKGRVVERYEPFFATGWDYQPETDAKRGQHAALHYDPRGQLVRTVNPDGSEQRLILGTPVAPNQLDDLNAFELSPWEMYTYDANDLAPLSVDPDGASLAARALAGHHYTPASTIADALGRVTCQVGRNGPDPPLDWFVSRSVYDGRGNLLAVRDTLGRAAFMQGYDLQNRLLAVASIDAGRRTSVLDAAGNLIEFRDNKGAVALRQYDRLNRLTAVWARDSGAGAATLRERLAYGDGGDPAQPAAARAASRARGQLGRIVRHFDEAGLLECDGYDFKGNLLDKRRRVVSDLAIRAGWTANWAAPNAENALEADAHQTTMVFDALNRPVAITYPAQTDGQRAKLNPRYNRAGALEYVELDGEVYVERIGYNAKGQRVLVVHGNGLMTRYAYDPATFRLTRLRGERVQTLAPANDTWIGHGQPLQDLMYTYDLAGNITSIEERTPGCGVAGSTEGRDRLTRRLAYDPLYRLVEANGRACRDIGAPRPTADAARCGASPPPYQPGATPSQQNAPDLTETYTETFAYDPAGNLRALAYQPATAGNGWTRQFGFGGQPPAGWAGAMNNRLTRLEQGTGTYAYEYDANGNLKVENSERRYAWDHADRLIGFTIQPPGAAQPSLEARYLYGADGQRVKKWVRTSGTGDGESTVYIDGVFEHVRWKKPGQAIKQHNLLHVIDGEQRIAFVRRGPAHEGDAGPPVQYHLADHLGSSSVVVDAAGGWVNREEYFPYGETSFGGFARKRYRFTGKERDGESGLSYHGARYYVPALARWVSCDPLGMADGLNLYSYPPNPLRFRDLTGLAEQSTSTEERAQATLTDSSAVCGANDPTATAPSGGASSPNDTVHTAGQTALGARKFTGGLNTPVGVSGQPLKGPLNLYSGKLGEQAADLASGYTIKKTPNYAALVAADEAMTATGADFSTAIRPTVWEPASRNLAMQAALSETPVASYGLDTHHNPKGTVQSMVERPTVRAYGQFPAGLMVLSGAATAYTAYRSENDAIQTIGVTGGSMEVAGGIAYSVGSARTSAPLMQLGSGLARVGGGAGGVVSAYALAGDIERGDVAAGVGDAAGTATGVLVVVGYAAGAKVAGAFSLGYGIGTLSDRYVYQPVMEYLDIRPGSGWAGQVWYDTFLKSGDWW